MLRPSSLPEPRDPSLKVVKTEVIYNKKKFKIWYRSVIYWWLRYPMKGVTATFESIHLRFQKLHALTVRFRFKVGLLIV